MKPEVSKYAPLPVDEDESYPLSRGLDEGACRINAPIVIEVLKDVLVLRACGRDEGKEQHEPFLAARESTLHRRRARFPSLLRPEPHLRHPCVSLELVSLPPGHIFGTFGGR